MPLPGNSRVSRLWAHRRLVAPTGQPQNAANSPQHPAPVRANCRAGCSTLQAPPTSRWWLRPACGIDKPQSFVMFVKT